MNHVNIISKGIILVFLMAIVPGGLAFSMPPYFTNCPQTELTGSWGEQILYDFDAEDPEMDPITYILISGPGEVDPATGVWSWTPTCQDVGSHEVVVCADDGSSGCDWNNECTFTVTVTNSPPVINSGPCGGTVNAGPGQSKSVQFTAADPDSERSLTWTAFCASASGTDSYGYACQCEPDGYYSITQDGLFSFTPTHNDDGCNYTFVVRVYDCGGEYDECEVTYFVCGCLWPAVRISRVRDQSWGQHIYVDVIADYTFIPYLDFDYLIGFDASVLTFVDVVGGYPFTDLGWEYFDYEYIPNSGCGEDCPTGLIRAIGIGDIDNGDNHPPEGYGDFPDFSVLYTIEFSADGCYTDSSRFIPINFYWQNCQDNIANILPFEPPYFTALSIDVALFNYSAPLEPWIWVTDPYCGFPTYFGAQEYCQSDTSYTGPTSFIIFLGGGVDILPNDAEVVCGNINGDCTINIFDVVYLIGYLYLDGPPPDPLESADVNNDGAINIFDVAYLISFLYLGGSPPTCP